jgi:hypothetical protein
MTSTRTVPVLVLPNTVLESLFMNLAWLNENQLYAPWIAVRFNNFRGGEHVRSSLALGPLRSRYWSLDTDKALGSALVSFDLSYQPFTFGSLHCMKHESTLEQVARPLFFVLARSIEETGKEEMNEIGGGCIV